jgi:hypothetical protein
MSTEAGEVHMRRTRLPLFFILLLDRTMRLQDTAQGVKPTERRKDGLCVIDRLS